MSNHPERTPSPEGNAIWLAYPPRSVPIDSRTAQTTRVQMPLPTPRNGSAILGSHEELYPQQPSFELAPVDRGKAAWTFVGCSFVMETLAVGFPSSFGVFQEYYLTHPPFNTSSEAMINSIGTITLALEYAATVWAISIYQKYPRHARAMNFAALVMCSSALILAALSTKTWALILTQGVLYGAGAAFLYAPVLQYLSEWFVQRRAFAASVIFAGTAVGGGIFPFLIDGLLKSVGVRRSLMILSGVIFGIGSFAIIGIKSRVPVAPAAARSRRGQFTRNYDLRVFRDPLYHVISLTILSQSFGYYPVPFYIPTYTTAVGLPTATGTLALSLFNLSTVVGQVIAGSICDRMGYNLLMIVSAMGSALASYLVWGFAHNAVIIYLFALLFGGVSGAFNSSTSPASADLASQNMEEVSMIMGSFGVYKAIAIIGGPLISSALHQVPAIVLDKSGSIVAVAPWYGGYGFTGVILFVGSMFTVTGIGGLFSMFLRARLVRG